MKIGDHVSRAFAVANLPAVTAFVNSPSKAEIAGPRQAPVPAASVQKTCSAAAWRCSDSSQAFMNYINGIQNLQASIRWHLTNAPEATHLQKLHHLREIRNPPNARHALHACRLPVSIALMGREDWRCEGHSDFPSNRKPEMFFAKCPVHIGFNQPVWQHS